MRGPCRALPVLATLMAGCGVATLIPRTPDAVAAKVADWPGNPAVCSYSGTPDAYIRNVMPIAPDTAKSVGATWNTLKDLGARDSYISVLASPSQECNDFVAGRMTGNMSDPSKHPKVVFSVVVRFKDAAAAQAAFEADVFGQSGLRRQGGVIEGTATDLGPNSALAETSDGGVPEFQAVWQSNSYLLLVQAEGYDPSDSEKAAANINGRTR